MAEHCQSLDSESWAQVPAVCAGLSDPGLPRGPRHRVSGAQNVIHVPTWGDLPHLGDHLDIGTLLEPVEGLGGAAILAHPSEDASAAQVDRPGPAICRAWRCGIASTTDGYPDRTAGAPRRLGFPGSRPGLPRGRQLFPLSTTLSDLTARCEKAARGCCASAGRSRRVPGSAVTSWQRGPGRWPWGLTKAGGHPAVGAAPARLRRPHGGPGQRTPDRVERQRIEDGPRSGASSLSWGRGSVLLSPPERTQRTSVRRGWAVNGRSTWLDVTR